MAHHPRTAVRLLKCELKCQDGSVQGLPGISDKGRRSGHPVRLSTEIVAQVVAVPDPAQLVEKAPGVFYSQRGVVSKALPFIRLFGLRRITWR
jgi:hypothetical protein